MEKLQPKHYALITAAVVALGAGLYFSMGGPEPQLKDTMVLVDVASGQLYEFNTSSMSVVIPAINPESGKNSLMPVRKEADGKWRIPKRYLDSLSEINELGSGVTDKKSGEVRVTSETPKFVSDSERSKR
ncbi:MAG TPA: hypothetical protein VK176_05775 [Phycisphaerales bacterium]|nr:hypothetical protein [Phycisphaerales bacterium]